MSFNFIREGPNRNMRLCKDKLNFKGGWAGGRGGDWFQASLFSYDNKRNIVSIDS